MNKALPIVYTGWCGLGFVRGINSYTYHKEKTENYLYLHAFGYGCCGIFLYTNPFMLPFSVYKELYRLEVNIRKLDENKDFYYQLF